MADNSAEMLHVFNRAKGAPSLSWAELLSDFWDSRSGLHRYLQGQEVVPVRNKER